MSTDVLADVLASLDVVVMERLPDGVFLRLGSAAAPAWFQQVFAGAAGSPSRTIAEALPFLAHFLTDAEAFWREGRDGRLRSEPFTFDSAGDEVGVVASAVALGTRRFLVLERAADFEERRAALQTARESALAHDAHVRRVGDLLQPVDRARALARQLGGAGLTAEQQQMADEIGSILAGVSRTIGSLAPLPKGVVRPRRTLD